MAHLIVTGSDRKVTIPEDQPLVIGRDPNVTLQIDDKRASRIHARVQQENGDFVLRDLESTNGTKVNDRSVDTHVLTNGDVVRIGAVRLEFQGGPDTANAPATKPAAAAPKVDLGPPRPAAPPKIDVPPPKRVKVKLESSRTRRRTDG